MKALRMIIVYCLGAGVVLGQATAPEMNAGKPRKVTTEDGRSFFGILTIKDDYTLRIETESGLANVPIASLQGDSWKDFSKDKKRSEDGRFWSERQDALTLKWEKEGKVKPLDSVLAEVKPYAPFIEAFKISQPDMPKPAESAGKASPAGSPPGSTGVEVRLFSGPSGLGNPRGSGGDLPTQLPASLPLPSLP